VFSSTLGTTVVLLVWARSLNLIPSWPVWTCLGLALLLATIPIWQSRALQNYRDGLAPELVRFDEARSAQLWRSDHQAQFVPAPAAWSAYQGRTVLELTIADVEEPAWRLSEPVPDWSAYQYLIVDVYQGDRWPLYLRVELRLSGVVGLPPDGRWQRGFELAEGATQLRIPLSDLPTGPGLRVLDLALVSSENYQGRKLYLGSLRLE
jgi:hypothetical protein